VASINGEKETTLPLKAAITASLFWSSAVASVEVRTRCHSVDPHAAGAMLKRLGAREVGNGALCRVVRTEPNLHPDRMLTRR
jgi:hypothetical protein